LSMQMIEIRVLLSTAVMNKPMKTKMK
jgi:hypothetical protein